MDVFDRISSLRQGVVFEDAEPVFPKCQPGAVLERRAPVRVGREDHPCDLSLPVFMAALPGGKRAPILKTMLTSVCERNCNYCFCRSGRDIERQTFHPEELAEAFMRMAKKGVVQGLFLSSGIAGGGVRTQDRLLDAADILRNRLGYPGYLHLKLMPGAEKAQVERAMQLSDRVSVNLEAPTAAHLQRLAPMKQLVEELIQPLRWVEEFRKNHSGPDGWEWRRPSSVTQFVVGAAGESDLDLLRASEWLHRELKLGRIYYSGFEPLMDTPFENLPAVDPWRRIRLYQADFLLRDYGFSCEDISYEKDGNLPLQADPKVLWANRCLAGQPLEINRAGYKALIRVPGIGKKGALAIIRARRKNKIKRIEDLQALGIHADRLRPFVLIDGRRPAFQPSLW